MFKPCSFLALTKNGQTERLANGGWMDGRTDGQTDRRIVWNSRPLHHITSRGRRTEFLCIFEMWSRLLFFVARSVSVLLFDWLGFWSSDVCSCCFCTIFCGSRLLPLLLLMFLDPVWWRTKIVDRCWGQCLQDSFIFTCFYPTTINCLVKQPSFFCCVFFSFKAKFVYLWFFR